MRSPAPPHPLGPDAHTGHVIIVAFTYVASVTLTPPNRHLIVSRFANGPPRIIAVAASPLDVSPVYAKEFTPPLTVVSYNTGAS